MQTFPDATRGKWQISPAGGVEPKWRHDGRELYYLALDGKLMSVSIAGAPFAAGRPAELFERRYDVASDGRFLMVIPSATRSATPYSVVVNWDSVLQE